MEIFSLVFRDNYFDIKNNNNHVYVKWPLLFI